MMGNPTVCEGLVGSSYSRLCYVGLFCKVKFDVLLLIGTLSSCEIQFYAKTYM